MPSVSGLRIEAPAVRGELAVRSWRRRWPRPPRSPDVPLLDDRYARRWRWRVERRKGPDLLGDWCDNKEEAMHDALDAGVAKWDRENGWFFDVFTTLEKEPLPEKG